MYGGSSIFTTYVKICVRPSVRLSEIFLYWLYKVHKICCANITVWRGGVGGADRPIATYRSEQQRNNATSVEAKVKPCKPLQVNIKKDVLFPAVQFET